MSQHDKPLSRPEGDPVLHEVTSVETIWNNNRYHLSTQAGVFLKGIFKDRLRGKNSTRLVLRDLIVEFLSAQERVRSLAPCFLYRAEGTFYLPARYVFRSGTPIRAGRLEALDLDLVFVNHPVRVWHPEGAAADWVKVVIDGPENPSKTLGVHTLWSATDHSRLAHAHRNTPFIGAGFVLDGARPQVEMLSVAIHPFTGAIVLCELLQCALSYLAHMRSLLNSQLGRAACATHSN